MSDQVLKINDSLIQHGKKNDRIYLMKLEKEDSSTILPKLNEIAKENSYSKIFAKIPSSVEEEFLKDDYQVEAQVPQFFKGKEDGTFMGKYFDQERNQLEKEKRISQVLDIALKKKTEKERIILENNYTCRKARKKDAEEISKVYKKVFKSYPFPIDQASYIKETMDDNVVYFGIWHQDEIVALSSSEMDKELLNVEMTDFAIIPDHRGKNLALYLLKKMEKEMKDEGIKTAYSIARSHSFGMNSTFSKAGYNFSGTLIQNTHIAGELESMNVWHKPLNI